MMAETGVSAHGLRNMSVPRSQSTCWLRAAEEHLGPLTSDAAALITANLITLR
jgi:hypothetical protein